MKFEGSRLTEEVEDQLVEREREREKERGDIGQRHLLGFITIFSVTSTFWIFRKLKLVSS